MRHLCAGGILVAGVVAVRAHVIWASVLAVVGVLFVALVLQSSTAVLWTGTRVDGYSQGGITYFDYQGRPYTILDDGQAAGDTARVPTAVYVPADDPGNARQDGPQRWVDAASVLVWFVAAGGVLISGVRRRRRRARGRSAT